MLQVLWIMSYLLLSRHLHFVFIVMELGSGEAWCHHAGHGFVKPGSFTKLLHLSLSFPFSHVTPGNMFISIYKTCSEWCTCKNQTIQAYSHRKSLCDTVSHKLYRFTETGKILWRSNISLHTLSKVNVWKKILLINKISI